MNDELQRRFFEIGQYFLPHSPIDQASLFAGRTEQIAQIIDAVSQKGRHVILFGERGVGKTSLAKVFHDFLTLPSQPRSASIFVPYVTCDSSDDYSTIWRKVFRQIELVENKPRMGFTSAVDSSILNLATRIQERCTPDDVVHLLEFLSTNAPLVVVAIDEFDRLRSKETTTLFADTIKILSDRGVSITLLLVGVADSVNELIQEHASAERACVQIRMPRMSSDELKQIIHNGFALSGMTIMADALTAIVSLSQGLPHYTHLLGLNAGRAAIKQGRVEVARPDVLEAIKTAVANTQESIRSLYYDATMSSKKTIYPQVLLACALAKCDEHGTFAAGDIRIPMSRIMKKQYDIPGFSKNLHDLCQHTRGPVLQRIGMKKRFRFRLANPLMQPFVIMHGLDARLISEDDLIAQGTLNL